MSRRDHFEGLRPIDGVFFGRINEIERKASAIAVKHHAFVPVLATRIDLSERVMAVKSPELIINGK